MCERELETEQNCHILTSSLSWPSAFLSRSPGLLNRRLGSPALCWVQAFSTTSCHQLVWSQNSQSGTWGLPLLGPGFLYRILSPTGLVSKLTDLLSSPSYIIVPPPNFFLWAWKIILIQPIHGQGYNILIDRMHLLFT